MFDLVMPALALVRAFSDVELCAVWPGGGAYR